MKKLILFLVLLGVVMESKSCEAFEDTDFQTKAALMDAGKAALTKELVGMDHYNYQRKQMGLAPGQLFDNALHAKAANTPLCGNDAKEWLELKCLVFQTVEVKPYCKEDQRCHAMRIASFVEGNPKLLEALRSGLREPAKVLPEPKQLAQTHQLKFVHVPGSTQPADVSWERLFLDTNKPVSASLTRQPDGVYVVKYSRR